MLQTNSRRRQRQRLYHVETLEARRLLALITVDSLLDNFDPDTPTMDGRITLREAILAANADAVVGDAPAGNGADEIQFAPSLFTSGPRTIDVARPHSVAFDPTAFEILDDWPSRDPLPDS